jgi:Cof subfamily protein (haloacid dehalogenase superfamily)
LDGVRLVAFDLDGTLLPADKRLTDRAKRVVGALRDAGIAVTITTGRGWTHASRYAEELGLRGPLVTFEGALVAARCDVAGRRVVHHRTLDAARIRRVAAAVADLDVGGFISAEDGRTIASRGLGSRLAQMEIWDPDVQVSEAPLATLWHEAEERGYILHLIGPPEAVREAGARVRDLALDDVETFHADFWDGFEQFQVRPRGIGKHVGLRHVLDEMGLGAEHVLAAGDWLNDLEMLQMARVAVAPANAVAEVRAVADHVLDGTCDDDAVVRFLEAAL